MNSHTLPMTLLSGASLLVAACGTGSNKNAPWKGDHAGSGGAGSDVSGSGGSSSTATGGTAGSNATTGEGQAGDAGGSSLGCLPGDPALVAPLPVPPGADDVPASSGTEANLRVLPWAGFSAAVSYTLDDTQPSQIEHWDDLKAEGVRMTFNAVPKQNWATDYDATWKDAVVLGHEIGNHTMMHCHADLTGCNNDGAPVGTLDEEIDQSSTYIMTKLGQSGVWTIAYPYGDTGYKKYSQARFFLGRGVNSGLIAPDGNTDPFNLPVIAAKGGEDAVAFNTQIDTAQIQGRWLVFLFHSILPTSNDWYAGVDISSITGSIEYAKGLGDVWIDSMVNVGAYWLGQRTLAATTPVSSGGTSTWTWSLPTCFPPGHALRVSVDGGTLSQNGKDLAWDGHGYYEVALDAGSLTWKP
jgi:hypothetical protein